MNKEAKLSEHFTLAELTKSNLNKIACLQLITERQAIILYLTV